MARRLKLTRKQSIPIPHWHWHGVRLRVDAVGEVDIPNEIFVYTRNQPDASGVVRDVLLTIASPADLAEYPAGGPSPDTALPYYRLSYVELDFRSLTQLEAAWTQLKNAAYQLVTAMDELEPLEQIEELIIVSGEPLATSDTFSTGDNPYSMSGAG
jgi:hypothetical protein